CIGVVTAALEAARHPEQVLVGDCPARVAGKLPFGNRRRRIEVEQTFSRRDSHQGGGDAFRGRPGAIAAEWAEARPIAFGDDVAFVNDDDTGRHHTLSVARAVEGPVEDVAEPGEVAM